MYYLTCLFEFEASHRLATHPGACKNLHGHSYKVEVVVSAQTLNPDGMVRDFSLIKKVAWDEVLELYDHTTILHINDPLRPVLEKAGVKVMFYNGAPTAELMAFFICNGIQDRLDQAGFPVNVHEVSIWETSNNKATYRPRG